jgi:hypothetical protein
LVNPQVPQPSWLELAPLRSTCVKHEVLFDPSRWCEVLTPASARDVIPLMTKELERTMTGAEPGTSQSRTPLRGKELHQHQSNMKVLVLIMEGICVNQEIIKLEQLQKVVKEILIRMVLDKAMRDAEKPNNFFVEALASSLDCTPMGSTWITDARQLAVTTEIARTRGEISNVTNNLVHNKRPPATTPHKTHSKKAPAAPPATKSKGKGVQPSPVEGEIF